MKTALKPLANSILVSALAFGTVATSAQTVAYDLDNGNAAVELVIPEVIDAIHGTVSPSGSDATLVLRITTLVTNAWFDATAPYHESAVGIYSELGRRPEVESATNRNINIALMYASYQVLRSLLPEHDQRWRELMAVAGLDPDNHTLDPEDPVGLGNFAGQAVVAAREQDGMNQLGNEGGRKYNLIPYADYTGYKPVNTAYKLKNPSRWQPKVIQKTNGTFAVQQFVTPQLRYVTPYSYENPEIFRAPFPTESQVWNFRAYKDQADEVLEVSANLNDEQKMKSEMFDNKYRSLGFSGLFASQSTEMSLLEFIHFDFLLNLAAFDTSIAIWQEKYRYDAVRPFSAIAFLYRDRPVTAWGGPGMGTVYDLPASEWKSYLNVADHPEYPSGSASFCAAHASVARKYLGSDDFGWTIPFSKGSSLVEPGVTPAEDMTIEFKTWTQFETDCGQSRLWGGVHFPASIPAGQDIGHDVAEYAYEFVMKHISGEVK